MHGQARKACMLAITVLSTLSGRMVGSSHVMKNGFGVRPGASNSDMHATRHVSLLASGRSRSM